MFKKPSRRGNKRLGKDQVELNLVPILDCLVTLIVFLLFTSAFLAIVTINSPVPIVASSSEAQKSDEVPLNLTVRIMDDRMLLEGGFGNIVNKTFLNLPTGEYDYHSLHAEVIAVKERYKKETKVILMPQADVSYDTIITVMDNVRELFLSDTPLYEKNTQGVDEPLKKLFPEVVFGNIISS